MRSTGAKVALVLVAALAGAGACRKAVSGDAGMPVAFFQAAAAKPSGRAPEPTGAGSVAAQDGSALAAMDAGRKLIRNGEISIEVRDFEAAAR